MKGEFVSLFTFHPSLLQCISMKELTDIAAAFDKAQQQQLQTALATVVQVEGSSYRRPGARMLITENGELTGAISGGCLEGDALRKARQVMFRRQSMLVTYDTMDEDDAKLGVGLGCNGIIHILIEPLDPAQPAHPVQLIKDFLRNRQTAVLVTLFSLNNKRGEQPGTMLLLTEQGMLGNALPAGVAQEAVMTDAREALRTHIPLNKQYSGELTGFIEVLQPPVSLIIFGAGNDAVPLTEMAALVGWNTTIVDGRPAYAAVQRFPRAGRVLVAKPEQALSQLSLYERSAIVLMTHNYNYDLAMLRQLLPLQLPYVGSLGPRKKLERMLDELQAAGMQIPEHQLQNIYGPTGLDIGAESADEIALSIMAEIKAVFAGRTGAPLRDRTEPIHAGNGLSINYQL